MQGCATFFLAGLYGIHLGFDEIVLIVFTATVASIGEQLESQVQVS